MSRCNYPYSWRFRKVICAKSCNPYPPLGIPEEGTAFGGERRFWKEKKKNTKEREKEKEEKDKDLEEGKELIDLIEKERKESFGDKDEENHWDRRDKKRKEKRKKDGETIGDDKNLRPTKLQRAPESYSLQPVASWSTIDDQDWLFPPKERPQSKSKLRDEEDTSEEVWTEAVYLSAVDMYALPYVNPWFLAENGKKK